MPTINGQQFPIDQTTEMGIEFLGQITRHLIEAQSVVEFLSTLVGLKLDELAEDLSRASGTAREAFDAANLLKAGAQLEESWSTGPSRPKAIFARHNAAVAAGAPEITDQPPVPLVVHNLPTPDFGPAPPQARGRRTTCGQPTKTTGKPCAKRRATLDDGTQADGCSQHMPDHQRPSWERHKARVDAWTATVEQHHAKNREHLMLETVALWLERQSVELGYDWEEFTRRLGAPEDFDTDGTAPVQQSREQQQGLCPDCGPLITDMSVLASMSLRALLNWAAEQRPPHWARPVTKAGGWLLQAPPKNDAKEKELSLYVAADALLEIRAMTPVSDKELAAREAEMIGASPPAPTRSPVKPLSSSVNAPRPGVRPTGGKKPGKSRRKKR
ncbi:hypothetical protein ACFXGA_27010 [Actinosynnema sp. NPDC059335]|uniref:hypothetical protein n=1 Tax=Actinosynnema sp. NPDC059335 TaxID=3346804 RepID=UPI0036726DCC